MKTITIMPDYAGAYCWIFEGEKEETSYVGGCCDLPELQAGEPHPLTMEFEAWQAPFEGTVPSQSEGFNWEAFHAEGLSLSRRLKASLGNHYRVVYQKPYEDHGREVLERQEVLENGRLVELASRRELIAVQKGGQP